MTEQPRPPGRPDGAADQGPAQTGSGRPAAGAAWRPEGVNGTRPGLPARVPRDPGAARPAPELRPGLGLFRLDRAQRRRERMIEEIQRNRRGEYTVPTWVLALLLVVIVGAWAALVIFA